VFALRVTSGGYESKETLMSISEVSEIAEEMCTVQLDCLRTWFFTICFMYSRFSPCMLFYYRFVCMLTFQRSACFATTRTLSECLHTYSAPEAYYTAGTGHTTGNRLLIPILPRIPNSSLASVLRWWTTPAIIRSKQSWTGARPNAPKSPSTGCPLMARGLIR
jgi:hypothetical protein